MQSLSDFVNQFLLDKCDEAKFAELTARLKSATEAEKQAFIEIVTKLEKDVETHSHNTLSICKLNLLGWIYHYGLIVPPNAEKAYGYLKLASTQDDIHIRKEMISLLKDLKKDADNDNAEALFDMANIYEHGLGPEQDLKTAFTLYKQAADKNHADAIFKLGVMYTFGHGVDVDHCNAATCFRKAYESGNLSEKYHPYLRAEMKQLLDKCTQSSAQYDLAVVLKDGAILNELAAKNPHEFRERCKSELERILPLLNPERAHDILARKEIITELPLDQPIKTPWYEKILKTFRGK
ncbi:MAG: tetratricopeptide repeat protein [Gammaproteobacteria bacterium]